MATSVDLLELVAEHSAHQWGEPKDQDGQAAPRSARIVARMARSNQRRVDGDRADVGRIFHHLKLGGDSQHVLRQGAQRERAPARLEQHVEADHAVAVGCDVQQRQVTGPRGRRRECSVGARIADEEVRKAELSGAPLERGSVGRQHLGRPLEVGDARMARERRTDQRHEFGAIDRVRAVEQGGHQAQGLERQLEVGEQRATQIVGALLELAAKGLFFVAPDSPERGRGGEPAEREDRECATLSIERAHAGPGACESVEAGPSARERRITRAHRCALAAVFSLAAAIVARTRGRA